MYEIVAYRPYKDIPLVTALPSNPNNGDMVVLTDSLSTPTYSWTLKYVAAKSSNKWVCIGGSPKRLRVAPNAVINTLSQVGATGYYRNTATDFVVPAAGKWDIAVNFIFDPNGSATWCEVSTFEGTVIENDGGVGAGVMGIATAGFTEGAVALAYINSVANGATIGAAGRSGTLGTNKIFQQAVNYMPVEIGG